MSDEIVEKLKSENAALLARLESLESLQQQQLNQHIQNLKVENQIHLSGLGKLAVDRKERATEWQAKISALRDDAPFSLSQARKLELSLKDGEQVVLRSLIQHVEQQDSILLRVLRELEEQVGEIDHLRSENTRLREANVKIQQTAEQEEEYISNTLLRRINALKEEKSNLLIKVALY